MADTFPSNSEPSNVDLLIGSDYFWSILGTEKVILPSGLYLISSKIGYILTGKYSDPDHMSCKSYTVQITHNLNSPRVSHACHTRVVFVSHACVFHGVGCCLAIHACGYTHVHAHEILHTHLPTRTQSV